MLKQVFRDSLVYGVAGVLSQGIQVLLVPFYTRVLSPGDYGVVDYVALFAGLVNILVALEISQGVARHYVDAKSEEDKRAYASSALWFTVTAYALFLAIALPLSQPLATWVLNSPEQESVFRAAILGMAGNGIFVLLQSQLRWQIQARHYAISSLIYTGTTALSALLFLFIVKTGIIGVFYGQIIGALAGIASSWFHARHSYTLAFSWRHYREMLGFSLPLVISSAAVFFSLYIDRFFIKELLGLQELGLYGIGSRFASVAGLLLIGIQGALTPQVLKNHEKDSTPGEIARIFRFFIAGALTLFMLLALFSKELLWLLTTPSFYAAWSVVPFLTAAALFANMYIFAPGLFIAKRTRTVALLNVFIALLNGALTFTLIPAFGLLGAAGATCFSAFCAFFLYMRFSQRLYSAPHHWGRMGAAVFVALAILALGLMIGPTEVGFDAAAFSAKIFTTIIGAGIVCWLILGRAELSLLLAKLVRKGGPNSFGA